MSLLSFQLFFAEGRKENAPLKNISIILSKLFNPRVSCVIHVGVPRKPTIPKIHIISTILLDEENL